MKYKIFLKSKRNLHTSQKLLFLLPNLCLLLFRSPTLSISIVSFSSNLNNRLNALSAFHKLEPIGNAQNLSLGFIYQNHAVEINTAPQQHWQKFHLWKWGVYLIGYLKLKTRYLQFQPKYQTIERRNVKNH